MKKIMLILFSFLTPLSYAQRLETKRIIEVSDSILRAKSTERLFKYFEISVGSYYKYLKKNNYSSTGKFLSKKKLKNNTIEVWVLYHFDYPEIEGIKGNFWMKLNDKLELIEGINLDFVPQFLWNGEPCNFISKQQALKAGIELFRKNGIKIEEPVLEYSDQYKLYTYLIINVLTKTKNQIGQDAGETEVIRLDAINGKLVERFDGAYGIIIR
jgi:hypothetical protein